jgi:hypothetical protein
VPGLGVGAFEIMMQRGMRDTSKKKNPFEYILRTRKRTKSNSFSDALFRNR